MTGYLYACNGAAWRLPPLLSWSLEHTAAGAADAFEIRFAYTAEMNAILASAYRFRAEEAGETVFYGVVDECATSLSEDGAVTEVSGRGLAALLLDSEAEAKEYYSCALSDILRDHAAPYGVMDADADAMGRAALYRVASGSSEWKALADFAAWVGGVTPRFSKSGRLVLRKKADGRVRLGQDCGVVAARRRIRRYGVVSEAVVKGNTNGARSVVKNEAFLALGGACRRVVCVPNETGCGAMRYTGEYQIARSAADYDTAEVTLIKPLAAFAGSEAEISLPRAGLDGVFFIRESRSWADGDGCGTRLTLVPGG